MRRLLLFAVLVTAVAVAHYGFDVGWPTVEVTETQASSTPPEAAEPVAPLAPSASPTATSSGPAGGERPGRALARAWLTAFLTRSDRDDRTWVEAVRPLSTPELVTELQAAGPDRVGMDQLSSWRVTKVVPFEAVDLPADTASGRLLAYTAVVTDGASTVEKPFELYFSRQDDGRWLVSAIDEPHSREG